MTYGLNNQGIITDIYTPYVCHESQIQCDSRNFHVDIAKPLTPSPISLLINTIRSMCLPFWTAEQQRYPKQIIIRPLDEEMSLLHIQIRYM